MKAILAKQTCDIIRARPEESARDILQTLLQISSVGDGVNAVWDRIKEAFIGNFIESWGLKRTPKMILEIHLVFRII